MVGSANKTVHDNVLEVTIEHGQECCTVFLNVNKVDGDCMSVAIEVAVHPVATVEDKLTSGRGAGNVVHHLHVQLEAVLQTVPSFCQIEVISIAKKNRLGSGVKSCGILETEAIPVELTASCADTILIIGMLGNYSVAGSVGEGNLTSCLTLAVGSC